VYRVLRVVLAVFALGVLGCEHAASPGAVAPAVSDAAPIDVFWKAFREAYPIHAQGVAFSEPSGDGTRTLVVAEPPPDVTAAAIASVDGSICDVGVRSHALGEDGWTKDLVAHVRGAVDVAMLNEKLARLLFGTAYGSYVLPVPAPAPLRDLQEPQVDMGDVRGWVNDSRNKLVDVIDGSRFSPKDLVHRANGGVYWSDPAGLVAWALPRGEVDDLQAQFRMFAVDSDLVLGAYASKSNVVILGRRRVLPIATYAPLRFESFCALTNTGDLELAQSFERGNPLSGKLPDGAKQGWDWAPIYLSPGVLDTEVGGVLNIADQLLKSLSNHGETTYDGFLYPSPPAYPFEQSVVSKTGATSITYNWNTRGFATLLDTGAVEYLNFGDTTALPITFLVADETTGGDESEDTGSALGDLAREKFAKSGDPYLIRATEYAALYQIVFNFDLESEETDAPGQPTEQTQQTDQSTNQDLAATYVRKAVDWLATASDKASARTRRPSASVLSTSMVWPDIEVTMSPGRCALPPGMFSTRPPMPTALTFALRPASAFISPITTPEPAMSHFMSSMPPAGLIEMPPVSKVTPLPTKASGRWSLASGAPFHCMMRSRGGWSLPCPTPSSAPMPSFFISLRPRISTSTPSCSSSRARSASVSG